MYYWSKKDELKKKAIEHTKEMASKYASEIKEAEKNTKLYEIPINKSHLMAWAKVKTNHFVKKTDSVSALFELPQDGRKICILNFASFKNAGGMFLNGSSAQEESLCHESVLFNVLKEKQEYYDYNRKNLNKGMYLHRALYTPNVVFERDNRIMVADVITCAAPNYSVALKYGGFSAEENYKILEERINFVKNTLADNHVDIAILGAWGCGVFKQSPNVVAELWFKDGCAVSSAIHAIPDTETYNKFVLELNTYNQTTL